MVDTTTGDATFLHGDLIGSTRSATDASGAQVASWAYSAFLYGYAGSPRVTVPDQSPFVDVPITSPFYAEILWMHQSGVSTGWDTPRGKEFRPYEPIDRDAMAAFLYRYDRNVAN